MSIASADKHAKVAVLMATYNGAPWLKEQVDSIATQQDVTTNIYVSDDRSTDATPALLAKLAAEYQLTLLPDSGERFGNANRNFLRLIAQAPLTDEEYVAFSDQDDIWLPDKLRRATHALQQMALDAYSSNVTAFWSNGLERPSRKAQAQRRYDHLFESAGPGCTFVIKRQRFDQLRKWVLQHWDEVRQLRVHDWLIYAYARIHDWKWHIDAASTLLYRQHGGNERGINEGWRAALVRWNEARSGAFLQDVLAYRRVLGSKTPYDPMLDRMSMTDRLRLAMAARHFRRRWRDQWVLAAMLLTMRSR